MRVRTMAFPLLGTGTGGFARDVCLDTMFMHLARTLQSGLTTLQTAKIVIYRREPPAPSPS
jgi:O-acetyl-ADP-ribose deacetylase (regulator of RNase III)